MKNPSLSDLQSSLKSGAISLLHIVEFYLAQIEATSDLNIYIEVFDEEIRKKAKSLSERFQKDPDSVGELFGMVISIKDVICYKDHKVTGGSKILENFESLYTATALDNLLKEDALVIGRVNCDEFGMGSSNENSHYGPVKNPKDNERVPGGSSGGSAASVAANTCLIALGSDTGGSVRQPASFCGIIGLKPTYGRVSRYGLIAYGSSFDQIGILGNHASDVAKTLEFLSLPDDFDSTLNQHPVEQYSAFKPAEQRYKIAYFDSAFNHSDVHSEIRGKGNQLITQMKQLGHSVESVPFEYLDYLVATYYVLTTAEASTNLSRYDGIRYGYRAGDTKDLQDVYKKSRTEGFGDEVKRRILLGTFVLSAGYYDAYFEQAQKIRHLISIETKSILEQYDFILTPTAPVLPWKIGEKSEHPAEVYLADIYTVHANLAGIPAISLPLYQSQNELPIGFQFMSNINKEAQLLSFANEIMPAIVRSNNKP